MNSAQKSKYTKCKYLVKKWESDFKKNNGTNPSKADIKAAPVRVKEAYRIYWELKTLQLETSLLDATFDENATDCFIASSSQEKDQPQPTKSKLPQVGEDSQYCLPLNDDTQDTSCVSQIPFDGVSPLNDDAAVIEPVFSLSQPTDLLPPSESKVPKSASQKEDVTNPSSVWGSHISVVKENKPKKTLAKSVSFQYAEKLFVKSKFSKRNPRKPLGLKRSLSEGASSDTSLEQNESKLVIANSEVEKPLSQQIQSSEESGWDSGSQGSGHFDLMNQLGKVVIHSAPKVTYQGVSAVQSALAGGTGHNRRLNAGWLARTTSAGDDSGVSKGSDSSGPPVISDSSNALSTADSTTLDGNSTSSTSLNTCVNGSNASFINYSTAPTDKNRSTGKSKISSQNSTFVPPLAKNHQISCVASDSDSGAEDLIYNSDDESKSQSSFLVPSQLFGSRLSSSLVASQNSLNTSLNRSLSMLPQSSGCHASNSSSQKDSCNVSKPLTEISLSNCLALKQNSGPIKRLPEPLPNPSKKCRIEPKVKFVPESAPTTAQTAAATVNRTANERKMTTLKHKVSSGKANDNYVKVNIQKKVFVKGKKNMKYSTYKKRKWKSLQNMKGGDSLDSGVLKCFKCGDVGHFARQCKAVGDLLPYEEDIDEESLFPTLAEAEEAAKAVTNSGVVTRKTRGVLGKPKIEISSKKTKSQQGTEDIDTENYDEIFTEEVIEEFNEDFDGQFEPQPEDTKPRVEPLYQLNPDGSLPDAPEEVEEALKELGFNDFRSGQKEAVMSILCGRSTLVVLATGAGKSLCYQLPAYLFHRRRSGALTLVVSPLVSLMEDQVFCCGGQLEMACLHRNQTEAQRTAVKERLRSKSLQVLLVSPEALMADSGGLPSLLPPLAFACIDEAHCLSHWSHNFRPSYLTVCQVLREKLGVKVMMGLTATITVRTVDRVLGTLGASREGLVASSSRLPENLILTASCDRDKDQALITLLRGERFSRCQSIIVYCTRREVCSAVASYLRINLKDENGDDISTKGRGRFSTLSEMYHAGLTPAKRKQVQKAFMTGKIRIVVATVAFGMGINKNDIRGVIHYNMPSSMENYVQEVGRAGRDGLIAHCHVFLDGQGGDLCELRRHIHADGVERSKLRKLLSFVLGEKNRSQKLCPSGTCQGHETAFSISRAVEDLDIPQENIATLLSYLELSCDIGVKSLPPAYTLCRVASYKGPRYLATIAKTCPPLAVGIAMAKAGGVKVNANFQFDVIRAASKINWDSGIVKKHLKELEWTKSETGTWSKSGMVIELSELGFRLISQCNLTAEQCDLALDNLHKMVGDHEKASLRQLQFLHDSLLSVSHKVVTECCDSVDVTRCDKLSSLISLYFTDPKVLDDVKIKEGTISDEGCIIGDIMRLTSLYPDAGFTGRAIAKIFHGIPSPNYPAPVWGRTKFWRLHLNQDFNALATLATKQLILLR